MPLESIHSANRKGSHLPVPRTGFWLGPSFSDLPSPDPFSPLTLQQRCPRPGSGEHWSVQAAGSKHFGFPGHLTPY